MKRVDLSPDGVSATVTTHGTWHVVHAVLSVITCGAWLLVWLPLMAVQRQRTYYVYLDQYGEDVWTRMS